MNLGEGGISAGVGLQRILDVAIRPSTVILESTVVQRVVACGGSSRIWWRSRSRSLVGDDSDCAHVSHPTVFGSARYTGGIERLG